MYPEIEYWLAMLPSWRPWPPINHDVPCRSCAKSSFFLAIDWPEVPHSALHGLITGIEKEIERGFEPAPPQLDLTPYVAPDPWGWEDGEAFRESMARIESEAEAEAEAEVRDIYVGDFIKKGPIMIAALKQHVVPRVEEWIQQQLEGEPILSKSSEET